MEHEEEFEALLRNLKEPRLKRLLEILYYQATEHEFQYDMSEKHEKALKKKLRTDR